MVTVGGRQLPTALVDQQRGIATRSATREGRRRAHRGRLDRQRRQRGPACRAAPRDARRPTAVAIATSGAYGPSVAPASRLATTDQQDGPESGPSGSAGPALDPAVQFRLHAPDAESPQQRRDGRARSTSASGTSANETPTSVCTGAVVLFPSSAGSLDATTFNAEETLSRSARRPQGLDGRMTGSASSRTHRKSSGGLQ